MQNYCYKCMKPLRGSAVCPHCGFDNAASNQAVAPYHLPCGTVLLGRYLVGRAIGEGGFGITYVGMDTTLTKRVAIKEFYPSGAANRTAAGNGEVLVSQGKEGFFSKGVERFLFEAKNVAAFSEEEGIVDVLDYFQSNGTAYIVMEFLDGETLKDCVNHRGCFKLDHLVTLLMPVMRSLGVVHEAGIIHRDISPDNIMFTGKGKLKLMDFGSARYYVNEERQMSVILKQGFAPEEQYRQNGEQGPHTDVYALCATIYACITGRVPVNSLDRLVEDTLQPPSELGVSVLPYQEKALMHGLAPLKKNRTPDMETLITELTTKPAQGAEPAPAPEGGKTAPADKSSSGTQTEKTENAWREWEKPQDPPAAEEKNAPAPAKKPKTGLIVAAAAAVLVIGGGIIGGIAVFGGGSGGQPPQQSASAVSESAAVSDASDVSEASAAGASSSVSSQFSTLSRVASSGTADEHSLYDGALTDSRADTADVSAEMALKRYLPQVSGSVTQTENATPTEAAVGNVVVFEFRLQESDLSESDKKRLTAEVGKMKTQYQALVKSVRSGSGVGNAQVAVVYLDADGGFVAGAVFDE